METSVFVTVEAGSVVVWVSYSVVCSTEVRVMVWPGNVVVLKLVEGAWTSVVVDVYSDVIVCVSVSVAAMHY